MPNSNYGETESGIRGEEQKIGKPGGRPLRPRTKNVRWLVARLRGGGEVQTKTEERHLR